MRFNPRANEVKAVADILQGEFGSYEDMAKAVLQASVDQLALRSTTAVLVKFPQDDTGLVYGPYYHSGDVKKAVEKAQEGGLEARTGLLHIPGRWEADEALETACTCGHQKEQHVVKVRGDKVSAPKECGVVVNKKKCPCTNHSAERKA